MPRAESHFFEGTIGAATNMGELLADALRDEITGFLLSNGLPAWELYDEVVSTPGSTHRVYRSKGDTTLKNSAAGDKNLILAIEQISSTGLQIRAHQDWSTASHTGSRTVANTDFKTQILNINPSLAISYFGVINEYGFVFHDRRSGYFHILIAFNPNPLDQPPKCRGVCRLAQDVSAGATVLPVDRNVSIDVGSGQISQNQLIAIVPVTPDGAALVDPTIDERTVSSITAGQIVLSSGITNDLKAGAIVGSDPNGFFFAVQNNNPLAWSLVYGTHHVDGTFTSALGQTANLDSIIRAIRTDFTGADGPALDYGTKNPQNLVYGSEYLLLESAFSAYRGSFSFPIEWFNASVTWVNDDRAIVDGARYYRVENDLRISQVNSTNRTGIGPGATDKTATEYDAWPWLFVQDLTAFGLEILSAPTIPNDGGYQITVTLQGLSAGLYTIHVGPNGDTTDPKLYSGVAGSANSIELALNVSGDLEFYGITPILPVGGPHPFTFVDANGVSVTSEGALTVIPHDFKTAVLEYRNGISPKALVGYRSPDEEDFPQT